MKEGRKEGRKEGMLVGRLLSAKLEKTLRDWKNRKKSHICIYSSICNPCIHIFK